MIIFVSFFICIFIFGFSLYLGGFAKGLVCRKKSIGVILKANLARFKKDKPTITRKLDRPELIAPHPSVYAMLFPHTPMEKNSLFMILHINISWVKFLGKVFGLMILVLK